MVPWESQNFNGLPGIPLNQVLAVTHQMAVYVKDHGRENADFEPVYTESRL